MSLGDSRTAAAGWQPVLVASLAAATGYQWGWSNGGVSSSTVASIAPQIGTILAGITPAYNVEWVLMNWGVNDAPASEAAWETDYLTIIDAVHAKWPSAKVGLMRPSVRAFSAADAARFATWIGVIQAARSSFVFVGPDEYVWFRGADDYVSESYQNDGVHYSTPLGMNLAAAQWQTAMGF